ncbi:MAG: histidinol-phosphatase [Alistipes sp.]|nr:histidinol-phosphatase [Alistipes sp.]
MKRFLLLLVAVCATFAASAQQKDYGMFHYQDAKNPDIARHLRRQEPLRREIIIPQVNGYNVYKADLHTHTIYSDGSVTPEYRVKEAWLDGLDVMACTEHIEYRRWEGIMLQYLSGHVGKDAKASNNQNPKVDFNLANKISVREAAAYGLTLIPGAEITRNAPTVGHYNALFVSDVNTIWDADPIQAIRNARKQGAVVMHNHPGWSRTTASMNEVEKKAYEEKLIDGVEIMNGQEFYPSIVSRASEQGLFVAANTDIHSTTAQDYASQNLYRDMTLILAKDKSLASLKEALLARRTLAYAYDQLAGEDQLLKDFFVACVKFETISVDDKGRRKMKMTNTSSVPFKLQFGNGGPADLRPFTSRTVTTNAEGNLSFKVLNMWAPGEKHPELKLGF